MDIFSEKNGIGVLAQTQEALRIFGRGRFLQTALRWPISRGRAVCD
jgi:hypothetical protein